MINLKDARDLNRELSTGEIKVGHKLFKFILIREMQIKTF